MGKDQCLCIFVVGFSGVDLSFYAYMSVIQSLLDLGHMFFLSVFQCFVLWWQLLLLNLTLFI